MLMEDAIKILMAFFEAMNKWEVSFHELTCKNPYDDRFRQNRELMRNSLTEIYEKFLSKKGGKTGRLAGPNIRWPPEYDLNQESIVFFQFINNKKVSIETLWQHPVDNVFTQIHRFTLIRIRGEWRVHKKEQFYEFDNKWENSVF
jgi:hypothetical protein